MAETVRDELFAIHEDAKEAYSTLENDDDPGDLADALDALAKRIHKLTGAFVPAIAPMRATAKALASIPAVKL